MGRRWRRWWRRWGVSPLALAAVTLPSCGGDGAGLEGVEQGECQPAHLEPGADDPGAALRPEDYAVTADLEQAEAAGFAVRACYLGGMARESRRAECACGPAVDSAGILAGCEAGGGVSLALASRCANEWAAVPCGLIYGPKALPPCGLGGGL